jgi:hypothetical protein
MTREGIIAGFTRSSRSRHRNPSGYGTIGWPSLGGCLLAWALASAVAVDVGETDRPIARAILISCDAMDRDVVKQLLASNRLPAIAGLVSEGSFREIEVKNHITTTVVSHATMLTGYGTNVHGIVTNMAVRPLERGMTIFERLERHFGGEGIRTLMVTGKPKLGGNANNDVYRDSRRNIDYVDAVRRLGSAVWAAAKPILEKSLTPRFLAFFHFNDPDEAGHKYGRSSREYVDACIACDAVIGSIVSWLKERGLYDSTRVYVTADHGFNEAGLDHDKAPRVFLATNDARVKRAGILADVPATIMARFGIDVTKLHPPLEGKPLDGE